MVQGGALFLQMRMFELASTWPVYRKCHLGTREEKHYVGLVWYGTACCRDEPPEFMSALVATVVFALDRREEKDSEGKRRESVSIAYSM